MAGCAAAAAEYALAGVIARVETGQPEVVGYLDEMYQRS